MTSPAPLKAILLSVFLLLFWGGNVAAAPPVILATEENPPANFTDPVTGSMTGVAYEKVALMMARARIPYEVRVLPWEQAFALARTNPHACVFQTKFTEERRPQFKWVSPLMAGGWALFARADWPGRIHRPQDLKGLRIGIQDAVAAGQHLEPLIAQVRGLRFDPVAGPENLRRLADGEVDLYAAGVLSGAFQAQQEGVAVRIVYRLSRSIGAMACHLDFDPDLLARMQTALDSIIIDGTSAAIDARYLPPSE